MIGLLSVGDPPIYRTPYGSGALVDFGGIVPEVFRDWDSAVHEVTTRSKIPASRELPGIGGQAPGSAVLPQDTDPGAPSGVAWPARARQGVARPAEAGARTG